MEWSRGQDSTTVSRAAPAKSRHRASRLHHLPHEPERPPGEPSTNLLPPLSEG